MLWREEAWAAFDCTAAVRLLVWCGILCFEGMLPIVYFGSWTFRTCLGSISVPGSCSSVSFAGMLAYVCMYVCICVCASMYPDPKSFCFVFPACFCERESVCDVCV